LKDNVGTAVILAGGQGLRLRPLTNDFPKAMINVAGKPLLEWTLDWLKENEIYNIIIGVAYKKDKIIDYFGDGERFGVKIRYSTHTVEGGTIEGFRLAIARYVSDDFFLAMNGDELVDLNIKNLVEYHISNKGLATITVGPLRSPYGVVNVEQASKGYDVIQFIEKPILKTHFVSTGTYVFSRKLLEYLPENGDIERSVFPKLASMRKLKAYLHDGFWVTINTIKDLQDAENQIKRR